MPRALALVLGAINEALGSEAIAETQLGGVVTVTPPTVSGLAEGGSQLAFADAGAPPYNRRESLRIALNVGYRRPPLRFRLLGGGVRILRGCSAFGQRTPAQCRRLPVAGVVKLGEARERLRPKG